MSRARIRLCLAALLAGLTLFRLYYVQTIPLAADETNYWQWSRHLAWGYFDQGPLIAWIIRLGTWALGQTELGVRITAVLLSLGVSLLLYDFCRRLLDDEALGLIVVLAANASLLFAVGAVIQTYDTLQAFLWLLGLELAGLAVFQDRPGAWYGAGAAAGLAMLAKYSSVLLPPLLFAFLLASPRYRFWLRRRQPWLAALLAGLIFSPNLVWNARHHWVAFAYTLGQSGNGFRFSSPEFLAVQAVLVGPVLLGLVALGLILAWGQARRGDERQAFLLWTSLPVLLLFFVLSAKTRIHGNWPAPGYLAGLLAAGLALKPRLAASIPWRRWGLVAVLSGCLLVGLALFHGPVLRLVKPAPLADPTAEIYGWPEMGRAIGQVLADWPGPDKPFIFGLRYQMASLAAFYTPGQPRTEGLYLPGQRLNAYLFWTDPRRLKGRDGLAVIDVHRDKRPDLELLFNKVTLLRELELKGPAGTVVNRVALHYCQGFKGRDARPAKFLKP